MKIQLEMQFEDPASQTPKTGASQSLYAVATLDFPAINSSKSALI